MITINEDKPIEVLDHPEGRNSNSVKRFIVEAVKRSALGECYKLFDMVLPTMLEMQLQANEAQFVLDEHRPGWRVNAIYTQAYSTPF